MRTKLSTYCAQFDQMLRPLIAPLDRAHNELTQAAPGTPGKGLGEALVKTSHHLRVLCDKVADQQAYVLIFGPLKSGKSTLMNAVAAAYVSEVSSLPAYPCLVFVASGPRREFVVSSYNGKQDTFTDPQALSRFIDKAHGELASAIRTAEQNDLSFDPEEHFPEAIRRVEVRVPDTDLKETGAVLVDTPGLYTRMRFGYDRMTREFRDAAACAIFVVKSDTLFLEQVFAEFHELLDLFSRIFLVINVDSDKRDVSPDGKLVPSLEQSRPEAILQAFRQLAMSAPLHRAAAEGRVRMYPVDLLHAASSVLQKQPDAEQPAGFVEFRKDLTEYLGSDDYMASFLRDSMQRAESLTKKLIESLSGEELSELSTRHAQVAEQSENLQAECDLIERALQLDLSSAFARAESAIAEEVERSARDAGAKLLRTLGASIDTWFLSGHSLHWLVHDQWTPLLTDYRSEVASAGRQALEKVVHQHDAGLDLPAAVSDLCERMEIDLHSVRRAGEQAGGPLSVKVGESVPLRALDIPLRKGLFDRVAFRSVDTVRHRLFGDPQKPEKKIHAHDKARKLGEPGRLYLHQCVTQFRAKVAPATSTQVQNHFGANLRKAVIAELHRRLRESLPDMRQKLERLARENQRLRALLEPLRQLITLAQEIQQKLPALGKSFGGARTVVLEPQRQAQAKPQQPDGRRSPRQRR